MNQGNPSLLLFFSGWSASPRLFDPIQAAADQDVWIVYDYRDMQWEGELSGYERIDLLAWSMGVGVVEQLFAQGIFSGIKFNSATAINGTPYPVHDNYGIPEAIFRGTLDHLNEEGLRRFNRRMCGSREVLAAYEAVPPRPLEEVREELAALYTRFNQQEMESSSFPWQKAVISSHDLIFPTSNQEAWWQSRVPVVHIEGSHYPFHIFNCWKEILDL
ncbi:biotin synthesis protein BioG [Parabacteroides sp. PFB2-12]|uniref:DUF452 family protein n=1 Tax=unclassified Parabacteroides TaxID=2649774 RepID=UPI002475E29C|nr:MULTISPECIES: pimeloyl-ACP methyl esterase BioG family protein [unclassified Parabacteroides]MDH6343000.1 biotin synthesis protein BioG [Parabacteroides sp. PM6-13]MDH6390985.1 biotin synthesis protein BioG [Parabacteroides sp. PFB2-12]